MFATPELKDKRAAMEMALEHLQRERGPDHPDVASALRDLGRITHDLGEMEDAQALLGRAIALFSETMGPDHPETATSIKIGRAHV